jgi:hypothetical protein
MRYAVILLDNSPVDLSDWSGELEIHLVYIRFLCQYTVSDACIRRPVAEVMEANIIADVLRLSCTCRKLYIDWSLVSARWIVK